VTYVAPHAAPHRRWRAFLVPFLIFGAITSSWALATPLMGVPDEAAHSVRAAAIARGILSSNDGTVAVPAFIDRANDLPCFAFFNSSAACQPAPTGDPDRIVSSPTSADANSPVYYALLGWVTLLVNDDRAFYAMRFLNVLLCSVMVGLAFLALGDLRRHRWAMIGAAVSLTPQVLFLSGSVNPNSLEATAAMALFTTLIVTLRQPSTTRQSIERSGALLASAALLASTRSIALLWVAIIAVAAFTLLRPATLRQSIRKPAYLVATGLTAAALLLSFIWYRTSQFVGSNPGNDGSGRSFLYGFASMLQNTFDFMTGWIAIFGTLTAPSVTYIIWNVLVVSLVAAAFAVVRGRLRIVLILLAAALILIPPIVQGTLIGSIGFIWQGRYNLALASLILITAGIALDGAIRTGKFTYRAIVVITALMWVAQMAAFTWALRRSVVGGGGTLVAMVLSPEWQPPLGTVVILVVTAVAYAAAAVAITRTVGGPSPRSLRALRN